MPAAYRPNLSVSQNFLHDPGLVRYLLERTSIGPDDLVYEIGPGCGAITAELVRCCRRVVAIEKDPALADFLRQKIGGQTNLSIVAADFLCQTLPDEAYKVFANIPFNHTSAIVGRLSEAANPPEDCYLVLQKEAAQMYLGQPRQSLRSVLLGPWFELGVIHRFRRSDFRPMPQVEAALLRIRKRGPPLIASQERQVFRDFVVYAYAANRPNLGGALEGLFSYRQLKRLGRRLGLNLKDPVTTLSCEQWLALYTAFKALAGPGAFGCIQGSERRLKRQQDRLEKVHRTRGVVE